MALSAFVELDRMAIGIIVRRLRTEKGISQEVLSGFAGLARSHLAMIETGYKIPNFETIWRIAIALGIYPHDLVKMIEDETNKKD